MIVYFLLPLMSYAGIQPLKWPVIFSPVAVMHSKSKVLWSPLPETLTVPDTALTIVPVSFVKSTLIPKFATLNVNGDPASAVLNW